MSNGGGVRSLRAMFENANSEPASPDVRGRSPGGARGGGDTSRPLSKVRTNFVSVEPLTKMRRNDTPSGEQRAESSISHRRESFSLNENRPSDAEMLSEIKKTISEELELRKSNSNTAEVVPENAIESAAPTPFIEVEKRLGMHTEATNVPSVTSTSVSRATSESRLEEKALDSSPPPSAPAKDLKSGFSPEPTRPSPRVLRNLAENLRTPKLAAETNGKANVPPTPTPAQKRAEPSQTPVKPEPAPKAEVAQQDEHNMSPDSKASPAISGAERASRAKSRVSSGTVTTGGFIKPKPRSPTRPINLPAHLVAPTASSAAKHGKDAPQQPPRTLSRRSSNISTMSHRPTIRPSKPVPARPKAPTAPRPESAAPKSPGSAAPASFLERMMRPTASSASKVKEKMDAPLSKKPFK